MAWLPLVEKRGAFGHVTCESSLLMFPLPRCQMVKVSHKLPGQHLRTKLRSSSRCLRVVDLLNWPGDLQMTRISYCVFENCIVCKHTK